jgi:vacuolar-type H+-ATPase catalytic subunit A/Vma1
VIKRRSCVRLHGSRITSIEELLRCQFISQNGFSVTENWCNYTIEVHIFEAVDNEKRSVWENSAPDVADIGQ